jgi:hypothetical protein
MMLAMGISGGVFLVQALISGNANSAGIILGDNAIVERSKAPGSYWFTVALFGLDFLVCPIVAAALLREAIIEYKRRIAWREHKKQSDP